VDGFIRLSAEGAVGTWDDYVRLVCPVKCSREKLDAEIEKKWLPVLNIEELVGFQQADQDEIDRTKETVKIKRISRNSFRSPLQIEAEAEVFHIIRGLRNRRYSILGLDVGVDRTYFISLSRVLNLIEPDIITSWSPEAVYRYLTVLPGESPDPGLLQQCMLNEYYYAGVSFVDKARYQKFFGPSINAARLSFAEQKESYLQDIEQTYTYDLDKAFESTPDLEKVFFVAQMEWRIAETARRREREAVKRAEEAEARAKQLEAEKQTAWKIRGQKQQQQEAAHLRHLKDPDWIKKRLRQAKKKRRKARK
jgi:hypothetical protein